MNRICEHWKQKIENILQINMQNATGAIAYYCMQKMPTYAFENINIWRATIYEKSVALFHFCCVLDSMLIEIETVYCGCMGCTHLKCRNCFVIKWVRGPRVRVTYNLLKWIMVFCFCQAYERVTCNEWTAQQQPNK